MENEIEPEFKMLFESARSAYESYVEAAAKIKELEAIREKARKEILQLHKKAKLEKINYGGFASSLISRTNERLNKSMLLAEVGVDVIARCTESFESPVLFVKKETFV